MAEDSKASNDIKVGFETRVGNVVKYCNGLLEEKKFRELHFSAIGGAVGKLVTAVEVLKVVFPGLYQKTKISNISYQGKNKEEKLFPKIEVTLTLDDFKDKGIGYQNKLSEEERVALLDRLNKGRDQRREGGFRGGRGAPRGRGGFRGGRGGSRGRGDSRGAPRGGRGAPFRGGDREFRGGDREFRGGRGAPFRGGDREFRGGRGAPFRGGDREFRGGRGDRGGRGFDRGGRGQFRGGNSERGQFRGGNSDRGQFRGGQNFGAGNSGPRNIPGQTR